jgi:hypothetical protein
MVRLISLLGSAIVVKHKIDEQALTAKILDISLQYLDLQRLRLAVKKAELKAKGPLVQRGGDNPKPGPT